MAAFFFFSSCKFCVKIQLEFKDIFVLFTFSGRWRGHLNYFVSGSVCVFEVKAIRHR